MTNVKKLAEIIRKCEQNKQTGDYQTLTKIFNTTTDAVRMRYTRAKRKTDKSEDISEDEKNTVMAMYKIIQHREELIKQFKNLLNSI